MADLRDDDAKRVVELFESGDKGRDMQIFECQACGHPLFFENFLCESCGRRLGFLPSEMTMAALEPIGDHCTFRPHY